MSGGAEAKARQRARNGTASGSSGVWGLVGRMRRKTWEDIEGVAVKGPDIAGQITDIRMLANRNYTCAIVIPAEYAHELVDAGHDSAAMFTMFRLWHVPRRAMLDKRDADELLGPEDDEGGE